MYGAIIHVRPAVMRDTFPLVPNVVRALLYLPLVALHVAVVFV